MSGLLKTVRAIGRTTSKNYALKIHTPQKPRAVQPRIKTPPASYGGDASRVA
jgi:hypothetical protein